MNSLCSKVIKSRYFYRWLIYIQNPTQPDLIHGHFIAGVMHEQRLMHGVEKILDPALFLQIFNTNRTHVHV